MTKPIASSSHSCHDADVYRQHLSGLTSDLSQMNIQSPSHHYVYVSDTQHHYETNTYDNSIQVNDHHHHHQSSSRRVRRRYPQPVHFTFSQEDIHISLQREAERLREKEERDLYRYQELALEHQYHAQAYTAHMQTPQLNYFEYIAHMEHTHTLNQQLEDGEQQTHTEHHMDITEQLSQCSSTSPSHSQWQSQHQRSHSNSQSTNSSFYLDSDNEELDEQLHNGPVQAPLKNYDERMKQSTKRQRAKPLPKPQHFHFSLDDLERSYVNKTPKTQVGHWTTFPKPSVPVFHKDMLVLLLKKRAAKLKREEEKEEQDKLQQAKLLLMQHQLALVHQMQMNQYSQHHFQMNQINHMNQIHQMQVQMQMQIQMNPLGSPKRLLTTQPVRPLSANGRSLYKRQHNTAIKLANVQASNAHSASLPELRQLNQQQEVKTVETQAQNQTYIVRPATANQDKHQHTMDYAAAYDKQNMMNQSNGFDKLSYQHIHPSHVHTTYERTPGQHTYLIKPAHALLLPPSQPLARSQNSTPLIHHRAIKSVNNSSNPSSGRNSPDYSNQSKTSFYVLHPGKPQHN